MKKLISVLLCLILFCTVLPAFALTYEELLQKAEEYIAAEEYRKAFACYDMAIKNAPDMPDAFIAEGKLYLQTMQYSEAYASVESALALDSTLPEGWLLRCRIDIASGDTEAFESDSLYAEICGIDLAPYSADIAAMYVSAGQNEKALQYFSAIPVDSLDEDTKQTYTQALIATGNRNRTAELGLTGDIRNKKLDAAFEADALRLDETDLSISHPEAADFELTDGLLAYVKEKGGSENPESDLAAFLPTAEIQLLSVSPAGNSALYAVSGSAMALYDGKYHIIYPAYEKGVEDTNGNLQMYAEMYIMSKFTHTIGSEGIVYSPDGRYAAVNNVKTVMVMSRFILDPVIIDLATGEMILTATYPNNIIKEENAGAITSACFSADSKSYFYTIYGRFGNNRVRLCRYDLETGNTEILFETEDQAWRPHLCQIADGSFMLISDGKNGTALARFENNNGEWSLNRMVPSVTTKEMYRLTDLRYSANSGYALLTGEISSGYSYAFQLLKPDERFNGFDRYLSLSTDTNEIIITTAEEYEQTIREHTRSPKEGGTTLSRVDPYYPYRTILNVILSPDGHYALLNTTSQAVDDNSKTLFLVRLDDLAVRKISRSDVGNIQIGMLSANYPILIEWNTDTLIIGTSDGIKTYRFDY